MKIGPHLAVVIPCFRSRSSILNVLSAISAEVSFVYVIDDCCPDYTGAFVEAECKDDRVKVIYNEENLGVGGAVIKGYRAALAAGAEVVVKIDSDGQMDPALIPSFALPVLNGHADYTKGNRFYNLEDLTSMPPIRVFGNAVLSLFSKVSTGYWNIFDPTNGYTAISRKVLQHLPLNKISNRFFFESDMLFRLAILRAVILDVPMRSVYGQEVSNLKIRKVLGPFLWSHVKNFFKRLFYNYYLRDMSIASFELPIGVLLLIFGVSYGAWCWYTAIDSGVSTPFGTVSLIMLVIILSVQFILAFLQYDISTVPKIPISKSLPNRNS
jgi:dolichol-phosphate mannosyltransferase